MAKRAHKVIPRSAWNAGAQKADSMGAATQGLFVHHTVADSPTTKAGEEQEMRDLQQIARSRGFVDISYSFIVFQSGRIWEGRGKGREGAHTIGYNDNAYAVAAAGNYDRQTPSKAMIEAIRWLRRQYLDLENRPVRPHSAVSSTACPGSKLRARISDL